MERLSPTAPVPVLLCEKERTVLGGAANFWANLVALGAEVVVGVIGQDEPGSVPFDLLRACPKLDADHLITDPHRPSTCKTRVMSAAHQLVRINEESRAKLFLCLPHTRFRFSQRSQANTSKVRCFLVKKRNRKRWAAARPSCPVVRSSRHCRRGVLVALGSGHVGSRHCGICLVSRRR